MTPAIRVGRSTGCKNFNAGVTKATGKIAADISNRPLRDCLSYDNGDGGAEPGSLAYYGDLPNWHAPRRVSQDLLEPRVLGP